MDNTLSVFAGEFDGTPIRVTDDGRFSVYDVLVAFVAPTTRNEVQGKGINPRQLFQTIAGRDPAISAKCEYFKFPGQGQKPTPVATQDVCEEILRIVGKHPNQQVITNDKFYPRTESQIVSVLIKAFADLQPIPQFSVHGYRIDLYLAKANIAVEVDEYGHSRYDGKKERDRERRIKAALGCSFVRFDPYSPSFNIGDIIHQVRGLI